MWDYDSLYKKSKLFVRKGLDHDEPRSPEVPLWCILSLELLARATLARVNPALLADPTDGANILYACGFPAKRAPTSIPAKTVFHRSVVVCEEFSERDYAYCLEWLNWRNEELHTGGLPLEQLKTSAWLADFFRISEIFLCQNGESLTEYVGPEHAKTANEMREALSDQKKSEAYQLIKEKREEFQQLVVEERLERLKLGTERRKVKWNLRARGYEFDCPACEGPALVVGNLIRSTTPKDEDGELVQDDVWLPAGLVCFGCGLKIIEHAHMHGIGLGDQFVTRDILDPKEYYGIEFDPADYYEADYGNE